VLPFLDHPGPIPFAHRAGGEAENTLAAFARAVALGFRYLETDVRVTADGVLVAFHDATLDRVCHARGAVAGLPWRELAGVRVAGEHPIPRLEELLEAFPDARFNVDPKVDEAVEPLVGLLRRTGAVERVCVGSFSERRLARVRRALGPGLCTALGPASVRRLRLAAWGLPIGRGAVAGDCVQVPQRHHGVPLVDARMLAAAHARGLPVHVWTVDDAAEMRRLLDLGVNGLMTDEPATLREVLVERGAW
jgi:glycerophosphoryl diester phosphodiesterase